MHRLWRVRQRLPGEGDQIAPIKIDSMPMSLQLTTCKSKHQALKRTKDPSLLTQGINAINGFKRSKNGEMVTGFLNFPNKDDVIPVDRNES